MIKVYLAGSMFCEADQMYNTYLAGCIRDKFGTDIDLYVPQENQSINDKTKCADSHAIFWGDYNRLKNTDIFIARIDGDIPPSGTSAEIGIMSQRIQTWKEEYERLKLAALLNGMGDKGAELTNQFIERNGNCPMIIGLCTDSRNPKRTFLEAKNELMHNADYESQYCYFNLFTVGCIKVNGKLATSVEDLLNYMEEYIDARQ